jgi:drug/metabolite transporter (DMT)-like permease
VSAVLASVAVRLLYAVCSASSGKVGEAAWITDAIVAFAYLIVVGSLVGFTAYVWLLRVAPISLVSTYAYVNPIVAVALGWLILDESVTAQMAVAGAAVLVSVAVILRSGGTSLEPGRGLFTKQRPIAVAAATEPTA